MDVPLALNDIGIRHGLKGYTRKSSTFSLQTDVVGLSAYNIAFLLERVTICKRSTLIKEIAKDNSFRQVMLKK